MPLRTCVRPSLFLAQGNKSLQESSELPRSWPAMCIYPSTFRDHLALMSTLSQISIPTVARGESKTSRPNTIDFRPTFGGVLSMKDVSTWFPRIANRDSTL